MGMEYLMLPAACIAVVIFAGAYVLLPLFRRGDNLEVELAAETDLDRLLDRKAVVYRNLIDLEFEYRMGRLSQADFGRLESGYKQEAALILQEIDRLGSLEAIDAEIEREISARKAVSGADRSRCPSCGARTVAGKKYCADCGHRL
jgi:hypothetical protein